jgi:hypothetical protein
VESAGGRWGKVTCGEQTKSYLVAPRKKQIVRAFIKPYLAPNQCELLVLKPLSVLRFDAEGAAQNCVLYLNAVGDNMSALGHVHSGTDSLQF